MIPVLGSQTTIFGRLGTVGGLGTLAATGNPDAQGQAAGLGTLGGLGTLPATRLMGPRCVHLGPFRPKGFCINHLQVFVKRRGSHWQPAGTLCRCLVFFLTLEAIIHPKWQKSETNFKNYPDFCDWQLISLVPISVVSL